MGLLDAVAANWRALVYGDDRDRLARSFVTGPAVVDRADTAFGIGADEFNPEDYGRYVATSNGVYACANLRARLLASVPLRLYRVDGEGEREEMTKGAPLALLQKVNPYWTFARLVQMTELSLCLWGEAFWFLERQGRTPRELWWARPDRVRVVPHPRDYVAGFLYRASNADQDIAYKPDEVVWLRYPNPLDQFRGLSPLAAARLSADVASAAMKSNRNIFANGVQMAGILGPPPNGELEIDQARQLEEALAKRMRGVDKAHRVAVLRYDARFQPTVMTPKDAEFTEAMKLSLEDICRAYGVPLDLIGGQRTYANVEASERIVWSHTIKAEAAFLAAEITEQLLPMFAGVDRVDLAEFDLSAVDALKEDEQRLWSIAREKIQAGVLTINDYRGEEGKDPVAWGDVWWAPLSLVPVRDAEEPEPEPVAPPPEGEAPTDEVVAEETIAPRRLTRAVAYGSEEHERRWRAFVRRVDPHERRFREATAVLFRRQRAAVLARLDQRAARDAAQVADDPFDRARWIRAFRVELRPLIAAIVEDAGDAAQDDLGLGLSFDLQDPNVVRFVEMQAQAVSREVNETTWRRLKAELIAALNAGESTDQMADRVRAVMDVRSRRDAEWIARTEATAAYNGGTLESWRQTGQVAEKQWLAAQDDRTRPSHVAAHGQVVPIGQDFVVGDGTGPHPGAIGLPEEDVACRCSMVPVLTPAEGLGRARGGNGRAAADEAVLRGLIAKMETVAARE